ncbi:MAG TPA: pyridoxal-dependent decarboxylase [Gemmatimonadales bacterium]|nr:pyridoxal-dependent decarboxylase [Gemmatimonadales bacterium]
MSNRPEETLDPADWGELRALGHRMVDDMMDYLEGVRGRPVWRPVPAETRAALDEPTPRGPTDPAEVYRQFREHVLPYPNGNIHPRFWGWVMGTGTPLAMLADMLASGMNPHLAGYDQSPALVERQVIRWVAELLGFPAESSGLLVSGGTVANLLGLAVARNARAGFDLRADGLQRPDTPRLLVYGSSETHSWSKKACELLGLGDSALRRIPVDDEYRVDVPALRAAIAEDLAAGHRPICVIGNAGTVNTGATDDLQALASLCREYRLWFHVDGAFGAFATLAPSLRSTVAGMEEADSVAVDLHKWGYLPFEVGLALVRHPEAHRATFATSSRYLDATPRGIVAGGFPFADLGVQLSRGFRALKVWMSLKAQGADSWGRLVEQNVAQARHLRDRVLAEPRLELLAPAPLNIVCFRYLIPGLDPAALDAVNEEILLRVQERGIAVPSSTVLGGRFALRVAITNHRSRLEDFDLFLDAVLAIGADLTAD